MKIFIQNPFCWKWDSFSESYRLNCQFDQREIDNYNLKIVTFRKLQRKQRALCQGSRWASFDESQRLISLAFISVALTKHTPQTQTIRSKCQRHFTFRGIFRRSSHDSRAITASHWVCGQFRQAGLTCRSDWRFSQFPKQCFQTVGRKWFQSDDSEVWSPNRWLQTIYKRMTLMFRF